MEKIAAIGALGALAQDNRLDVFRLLVEAGPKGMAAGQVATALALPPNTLSFHFDRLRQAGLVSVRREGRSLIYAARYETMNALLDGLPQYEVKELSGEEFARHAALAPLHDPAVAGAATWQPKK